VHFRGKEIDMIAYRRLTLLAVGLALSACGASQDESREPPLVEETVFGDAVGTMEKARAVEDTTRQHKEDLDRAMEAAEGGQ
jgi:hypothetical protein